MILAVDFRLDLLYFRLVIHIVKIQGNPRHFDLILLKERNIL